MTSIILDNSTNSTNLTNSTTTKTKTITAPNENLSVPAGKLDSSVDSWTDYLYNTSGNSTLTIVDECYF